MAEAPTQPVHPPDTGLPEPVYGPGNPPPPQPATVRAVPRYPEPVPLNNPITDDWAV